MTICPHSLDFHYDVNAATPQDGEVLTYSAANGVWFPSPGAGSGSLPPHVLSFHTDVSAATPGINQVLGWNGSSWEPMSIPGAGPLSLNNLTDVVAPVPTSGDVLTFNGGVWVPMANGGLSLHDIEFHSNVTIQTPVNGEVLTYNAGTQQWVNSTTNSNSIAGLSDVNAANPAVGNILEYNGTSWVLGFPAALSTHTLNFHSDVNAPLPANGDVLTWSGTSWVSAAGNAITSLGSIGDVNCPVMSDNDKLVYDGNSSSWVCTPDNSANGAIESSLQIIRGSITKAAGASVWSVSGGAGFTVTSTGTTGNNVTIVYPTGFTTAPTPTFSYSQNQTVNGPTTFDFVGVGVNSISNNTLVISEQWDQHPSGVFQPSPGVPNTADQTIYFTLIGV